MDDIWRKKFSDATTLYLSGPDFDTLKNLVQWKNGPLFECCKYNRIDVRDDNNY